MLSYTIKTKVYLKITYCQGKMLRALISLFSRAKDEDISSKEYLNFAQAFIEKAEQDPKNLFLKEETRQQMEVVRAYYVGGDIKR